MNGLEGIRLEVFRQLKEEIRGSQDYLIVGIDVARDKHHAFLGTATCTWVERFNVHGSRLKSPNRLLAKG